MSERSVPLRQISHHPRDWHGNLYVYPVISRRSRGLSIGVNLNPDTACNFDCVYCQVDRSGTPRVREVDPQGVHDELVQMIELIQRGTLFEDSAFADVPAAWRSIKDIAFSGDGEPTTCKAFEACVQIVATLRKDHGLAETKIVLITDACYLTKPAVEAGLAILDRNNGEIWAKLDAGTEAYYCTINRPNYPLTHVLENIIAAARVRPVVIQSLFMNLDGNGPDDAEVKAYTGRLKQIVEAGGKIACVQVYTVARRPAEDFVTALSVGEVDRIGERVVADTGLTVETFYGPEP